MNQITMHPEFVAWLGDLANWPKFVTMIDERLFWDAWCAKRQDPRPKDMTVTDGTLPGPAGPIPIRTYRPAGVPKTGAPCFIYFHGGGFVTGTLDTCDTIAWRTAASAGVVVVSVDYRLAPEHRFPAAFDDAYAATVAVAGDPARFGIDPARIAVGGDSAGGNLAAAVCLAARDRKGPKLSGQVLVYPSVGAWLQYAKRGTNGGDPTLSDDMMAGYHLAYFGPSMTTDSPYGAPIKAASHAGLPPCFIVTAELDSIRGEGDVYAAALGKAGVPVELWCAPRLGHTFWRAWSAGPAVTDACERIAGYVKRACRA